MFPFWEESDNEDMVIVPFDYEPESVRPSPSGQKPSLSGAPVVLDVTFTKQSTKKYKRCTDGKLTVFAQLGVAKLEDDQGTYLASCDFGAVPSLVDRWNAAFDEEKGLEITKGFGSYLVYVCEVSTSIQARKTQWRLLCLFIH